MMSGFNCYPVKNPRRFRSVFLTVFKGRGSIPHCTICIIFLDGWGYPIRVKNRVTTGVVLIGLRCGFFFGVFLFALKKPNRFKLDGFGVCTGRGSMPRRTNWIIRSGGLGYPILVKNRTIKAELTGFGGIILYTRKIIHIVADDCSMSAEIFSNHRYQISNILIFSDIEI